MLKKERFKASLLVVSMLLCFAGAVKAQVIDSLDLDAKVARNAPTTYQDLLDKIMPDARAARTIPFRQLNDMSQKIVYTGVSGVSFREGLPMQDGGKKYLLALIEISPKEIIEGMRDKEPLINGEKRLTFPTLAIALFRVAPQPEFLDAAEIWGSVMNSLKADNLRNYFWVITGHQNCLTEYDDYTLLKMENEQLRMVYNDLPMLSDSTDCSRKLKQRPVIAAAAGSKANPMINLTVVSTVKQYDEACTGRLIRKYTKYFRYQLIWDRTQKKYVAKVNSDKALHAELVKFGLAFDDEQQ